MKKIIAALAVVVFLTGCIGNIKQTFLEVVDLEKFDKHQIKLLELHNKERESRGYKPFILDKNLCDYAEKHSKNMVSKNSLYHSNMADIRKVNPNSNWVGENVAWGQETEESVVNSWMWSPAHRWNILASSYSKVGFGIAKDSKGRIYWCSVFSD